MYTYATATTSVGYNGGIVRLTIGDAWFADDPFVRANPGFFAPTPPNVKSTVGRPVETASAAPGEKRRTK